MGLFDALNPAEIVRGVIEKTLADHGYSIDTIMDQMGGFMGNVQRRILAIEQQQADIQLGIAAQTELLEAIARRMDIPANFVPNLALITTENENVG